MARVESAGSMMPASLPLSIRQQGGIPRRPYGHAGSCGRPDHVGHHQGFEHECVAAELPMHEVGTERPSTSATRAGIRSEELAICCINTTSRASRRSSCLPSQRL